MRKNIRGKEQQISRELRLPDKLALKLPFSHCKESLTGTTKQSPDVGEQIASPARGGSQ